MAKRKKAISKKKPEKTKATPKEKSFKAILTGGRVFSNAQDAFTLYEQSRFGEPTEGKIYYSLAEALYLIEKGKLQVSSVFKRVGLENFWNGRKYNG